MKTNIVLFFALLLSACSNGQNKTMLSAVEFGEKVKSATNAIVLDVRTPEEFSQGHIKNAININFNGTDFDKQIANLDKNSEVLVYCLAGGRSASAAEKLSKQGFGKIFELSGGMMKWRAAKMPEETNTPATTIGLTKAQFEQLLDTDKKVLVDFYATWCAPCKIIKPYLDQIETEMKDKVVVVRIDADQNRELVNMLQIDALPTLQVYKNKQSTWTNVGLTTKEEIVKALNK